MAPDTRYEIKETSRFTFEVFDTEPTLEPGPKWIGSFCYVADALACVQRLKSTLALSSHHRNTGG
jgi:hypothetical protein